MKIFSNKLLRRELKLDLVIAGNAWRKHFTVAGRYRELVLVAQGHVQIDWFWLNGRVGHFLNDLPFAREPSFCCLGVTIIVSKRLTPANPVACTMTSPRSAEYVLVLKGGLISVDLNQGNSQHCKPVEIQRRHHLHRGGNSSIEP